MILRLDTPLHRIVFAIGISLLLHGLALWGPSIHLPRSKSSLTTLTARLEALPAAAPVKFKQKPKQKRKAKPIPQKIAPEETPKPIPEPIPEPISEPAPEPIAELAAQPEASPPDTPLAASAPGETESLASEAEKAVERPPLPRHAQLTFAINKGTSHFRVGEAIHTLEIENGRYMLKAVTRTVGLVKLFKSYELNQYSNGSYGKYGLQPELFTDQHKDRLGTQQNVVELDRTEQRARFSRGGEVPLPPDTQDILSVMYQFPPVKGVEIASVHVSNGRKIEQYEFEIATEEEVDTSIGKLLAVRLRKIHAPNEEGLEIWLAREYRLFPVKMRFIERNGEVAAEAVITDIRVSEESGERSDVIN